MGYTHTWTYLKPSLSVKDWTTLINAVKLLLANLPEHTDTAGGYYKDAPLKLDGETVVNNIQIAFNGAGEHEGESLEHETFVLERSWRKSVKEDIACEKANRNSAAVVAYFEKQLKGKTCEFFCKTARKPYDLAVCGVLATACHLFPEWITITSDREDGERTEWLSACQWASKVTGYDVQVPVGVLPRSGEVENGTIQVLEGMKS